MPLRLEDLQARGKEESARLREFRMERDALDGTGGFRPYLEDLVEGQFGVTAIGTHSKKPIRDPADRCYLDRHPRENDEKFMRRRRASFYLNLVRRVHRMVIGFMFREGPRRKLEKAHPWIVEFVNNADGKGAHLDRFEKENARRALQFGTGPILFNGPRTVGAKTEEEARRMAGGKPLVFAENLYPEMVADHDKDADDELTFVKLLDLYSERPDYTAPARVVTRARYLTRTLRQTYLVRGGGSNLVGPDGFPLGADAVAEPPIPHSLGRVPMVFSVFDRGMSGSLFGSTPMWETVQLNRELFNTHSREGEHERGQVFALLVVQGNKQVKQTLVLVGTENALMVDPSSTLAPSYLAPPSTIAATLMERIQRLRRDLLQLWGLGYYDDNRGGPESGTAMQQQFREATANFSNFAANLEDADEQSVRMALQFRGMPPAQVDAAMKDYGCTYPRNFDLYNLAEEIDKASRLLAMPMDVVAKLKLITKLRDMTVDLDDRERKLSDNLLRRMYGFIREGRELSDDELLQALDSAPKERKMPPAGDENGDEGNADENAEQEEA